jgi:hypothetical protein
MSLEGAYCGTAMLFLSRLLAESFQEIRTYSFGGQRQAAREE